MSMDEGYAGVKAVVERFKTLSRTERQHFNEQNTRKDFILPLFRALEWDVYNSAEVSAEDKVSRGWVDFAFRLGGVPRFFLETKAIKEDLTKAEWVKQAIDYAWTKSVTWAVLSDFEGLRVFNAEWKEDDPERARFIEFGVDDYLPRFEQLWWLSRSETAAGRLDREAEKWGKKVKREPVSQHLFDDLRDWRSKLFNTLRQYNKQWSPAQIDEAVLVLLNRMIFMRAAEDREVEPRRLQPLLREVRRQDLLPELRKLFRYFDATYNSQLFATHRADILDSESQPFETLIAGLYGRKSTLYNFNAIDADVLGTAYEQYLGHVVADPGAAEVVEKRTKRKSQGIYYTPSFVVKYIVQQTVGRRLREDGFNPSKPVRILDMACGSGSFLIEAFDVLDRFVAQQQGAAATEGAYDVQDHARQIQLLQTCIYGVDKDEQAVAVARLNLLLKALHVRDKLPMLANIRNGDSLISGAADELKAAFGPDWRSKKPFNWAEEFPEVMEQGGFDVIIGNPPYVRQETLGDEFKAYAQSRFETYAGTADLYVYFIERAMKMLKAGGYFGFIVANKWMRANYGKALRQWLKQQDIVEVIDFGDLPVFQTATTYPCIIIMCKGAPAQSFAVTQVKSLDFVSLDDVVSKQSYKVSPASLDDSGWSLSPDATQTIVDKMNVHGTLLNQLAEGRLNRGIITGLNEAFVIDDSDARRLISEDARNAAFIKPFLLGREVKRYAPLQPARYLLFIPNGWTRQHCPETGNEWQWLSTQYPAVARHLARYEDAARKRWDKGEFWWELRPCDYYAEFEKPKIVAPAIVQRAAFSFDDSGAYSNDKTSIICGDDRGLLFFLLAILNSSASNFYLKLIASTKQGGYFEQKPVYLAQLPIPRLDLSDPTDKARRDQMVTMVDEMLALQKEYAAAERNKEDNRHALKGKIDRLDAAIDNLVYELYGLTEEEIAVVESSR